MKINPTIARLDRTAARLGVELKNPGHINVREFNVGPYRTIQYAPGGKGVIRLKSFLNGELDSETVAAPSRVEQLFTQAKDSRT